MAENDATPVLHAPPMRPTPRTSRQSGPQTPGRRSSTLTAPRTPLISLRRVVYADPMQGTQVPPLP